MKKVDVLINVFGKPYQTALALLSLIHHNGNLIDKIYFHQEPATPEIERRDNSRLLEYLRDKIIFYQVPIWLSNEVTDEKRLFEDSEYRLSLRYQYGFEHTDKKFALLIHNDIEVTGNFLSPMLAQIGEATAIGEIGQCWWCPAGQNNLCSSEHYTKFRPKYHQLMYLYNTNMDYKKRRAYNLGLRHEFWVNPWPLPECRINEWCLLMNMEKAKPATFPQGKATPFGAYYASGSKIGTDWEDDVTLDLGVWWFRELNHAGHTFRDFPVEDYINHDRRGQVAVHHNDLYVKNEIVAKHKLMENYGDAYKSIFG